MPPPQTSSPPSPLPDAWDPLLADLVATIGSEAYVDALRQLTLHCCHYDSMVISRFQGTAPPQTLYHDLDRLQAAVAVDFYATGPYLLDPLYQACRNGLAPGIFSVIDVAPEAFTRSEYFRTFFRKNHIVDELGLLIPDGPNCWIQVSLARDMTRPRFDRAEIAALKSVFATLAATVRRHWHRSERTEEVTVLDQRLESFAADCLSPREREIVLLVLQGHSSPSAAALLGISEGTVKVHRHHAYTKLGIASQAELFSLAMRHLASARA